MPLDDFTTRRITETIARAGWHISLVHGGPVPTYAYTIGMTDQRGFEVMWAGGCYYAANQMRTLLNTAGSLVLENHSFDFRGDRFTVASVDDSWARLMAAPAFEVLKAETLSFVQVIPTTHKTADVPDMSRPFDAASAGPWRWLTQRWIYSVPMNAVVSTDLNVLTGDPVTEIERWDETTFAAHGAAGHTDADLRQVPFGTVAAIDPGASFMAKLKPGQYALRDGDGRVWREPADLLERPV